MRSVRFLCYLCVSFYLLGISCLSVCAQSLIQGKIIDQDSQQPVAGATILAIGSKRATSADKLGNFRLSVAKDTGTLEIRALGFQTRTVALPLVSTEGIIELQHASNAIEEVAIRHQSKYSNKNNKAVDLIDLVIAHKKQNRLSGKDSLQFDQYDKLKFGMIDPGKGMGKGALGIDSLFSNVDTTSVPGKQLLTIYQEESNARVYGQRNPAKFKKVIHTHQKTELDQRYINNPNIQAFMNYIFQQIDVYDESIFLLNRQFLSPIADNGKLFYRYYITDTIFNDEGYFIRLNFEPRNQTDLLFSGDLEISMDGTYAVKRARLKIDQASNLNWVKEGELNFHYAKDENGVMLVDSTRTALVFGVGRGESVFANRVSINENYRLDAEFPAGTFKGASVEVLSQAEDRELQRPIALTEVEKNTYRHVEELDHNRRFQTVLALGYLAAQGYYNMGIFELGPLEYLYSRNNVEGNRFRLGGRTTQALTDKAFLEGYLAYGLEDARAKYFLRGAYSLNGESIVTFPAHYLEASIQNDIMEPGQQIGFLKGDSFFRSIRKNRPTKWFDTQAFQVQHVVEFGNHVSVTTGFSHTDRTTVGDLRLITAADPEEMLTEIGTNELHVDLRWAPFEKFFYRNLTRKTIIEKHPVFNVMYTKSLNGFWNTSYPYDKLSVSASKRFFLGQLGFADARVVGGKIWGTLPYTMLELPNVKQKEDRHRIDFDLMNPMEFVADEYLKIGFFHQMQGFLLNKIPLIKKLNLREVWGAQMFYGKLSDQNNPYISDRVVEFDRNNDGDIQTYVPNLRPYWEASVGLDNILNVLRVEYVKRFTYNGLPNVNPDRYRLSVHINF